MLYSCTAFDDDYKENSLKTIEEQKQFISFINSLDSFNSSYISQNIVDFKKHKIDGKTVADLTKEGLIKAVDLGGTKGGAAIGSTFGPVGTILGGAAIGTVASYAYRKYLESIEKK